MYIYNPENGSSIKGIWIYDKLYFDKDSEFLPGMVIQAEDKIGSYLTEIYGFLEEVGEDKARKLVEDRNKKKYACTQPGCTFSTPYPMLLGRHMKKHSPMGSIDGVVVVQATETKEDKQSEGSSTDAIENETKREGLEGPGLQEEFKKLKTI